MKLCYFVHDLGDAAVQRRVRMLREGGACVTLIGFRRAGSSRNCVSGVTVIELGQTEAARLSRRGVSVLAAWLRLGRVRGAMRDADIIIARQLETLVLAAAARHRFAPSAPIVFECLDIHRTMSGASISAAALRWVEGWLLRRCALLIVSSPAFVTHHFGQHRLLPPVRLVENKALGTDSPTPLVRRPRGCPQPWRIGWFGVLRCRRSLLLLIALVRAQQGRVEVVLRGRPAYTAIPDWNELTAGVPGLRYDGPYDGATELASLYTAVDFTWAIDFFEAGANSTWLLPNRLYEGGMHGSVPLAIGATETGHWLAARSAGVLLGEPLAEELAAFFANLTEARYTTLSVALPLGDVVHATADCKRLVADLEGAGQADRRSRVSTSMAA